MNTNNVKRYAPKARLAFIEAVSKQAAKYGVTKNRIEPAEQKGDLVLIGDRPFPASVIKPRDQLVRRIKQQGFDQVMEYVAYSWFNRLCAFRYMELKDYLDHGRRVLSSPNQAGSFQILDDCLDIELPGLDQNRIRTLKLDGTQDEILYRELLLAQCHALHDAMPFLFEAVDDETELLLPENLTKTDSLIHELVNEIPEEDWQSVEIIGWLYQFYISEKKDEVIGKVVNSEDIPAATQLFTPNWIVKYMVQNSLGAQWLATYPESPLKASMEYYITPAEQTDDVKAHLKAITPSALNPEELTLIDPACGSGHILVEAYELYKAIYLERGYRQRDIPQLILEKNLYGLDIDARAAQLTGFALMMKGREDDRRLFDRDIQLNLMAMADSSGFDVNALAPLLPNSRDRGNLTFDLEEKDLIELKNLFENTTTFGSLIQVPAALKEKIPTLKQLSEFKSDDLFLKESLDTLKVLVRQAEVLVRHYDSVIANPPYMGQKYHNSLVKSYAKNFFPHSSSDLYSICIERYGELLKPDGQLGLMTPFTWMFLKSYEKLREKLLSQSTFKSLIHPEYHAIWSSAAVPICTFIVGRIHIPNYTASFIKLTEFYGEEIQPIKALEAISNPNCGWFYRAKPDDFEKIPGCPLAYWVSDSSKSAFTKFPSLESLATLKHGMSTSDNGRFLRQWYEVSISNISIDSRDAESAKSTNKKWFPFCKGGAFRRWYGNSDYVVNWKNDGAEIKAETNRKYPYLKGNIGFVIGAEEYYFQEAITWSSITSSAAAFRYLPSGFIICNKGQTLYSNEGVSKIYLLAALNSKVAPIFLDALSPTIGYELGYVKQIPIPNNQSFDSLAINKIIDYAKADWDGNELSWNFKKFQLPTKEMCSGKTLEEIYFGALEENRHIISEFKKLEEKNNQLFIDAYGLSNELSNDVQDDQITLLINPSYRYNNRGTDFERNIRYREDTIKELVSYSIGCMMGRYSLDEPGLIYAHTGNEGFDSTRYQTFQADNDGIIPLTDKEWFNDDAANRLEEFIATAWDAAHLEQNLAFLADNLSPKKGESSRETLRRYLCDSFFKDHLQTYKKRPIYWLFNSGKQKTFQCLVYLHRYNEGTLARMRTQYVIPLTAKLASHVNKLEQDKGASTSTSEIKKLEKEIATLHKQQAELSSFDEKLRHYADQRIILDLDDGVKVNYGRFGDLLAEVKAITGDAAESI